MQELDYGFKVAKKGKGIDLDRPELERPEDFLIHTKYNALKIAKQEHDIFSIDFDPGDWVKALTLDIKHNLGYNPLFFGYGGVPERHTEGYQVQYFDPGVAYYTASNANTWYAQSIIAPATGLFNHGGGVSALRSTSPSGTAKIRLYLYTDSSGSPGSSLGEILYLTTITDPTYWMAYNTPLTDEIYVTEGDKYWVVYKEMYGGATYMTRLVYDNTNPYSGGAMKKTTDAGSSWSSVTGDTSCSMGVVTGDRSKIRWVSEPSTLWYTLAAGYHYLDLNTVRFQLVVDASYCNAPFEYKYFILYDPAREPWYR